MSFFVGGAIVGSAVVGAVASDRAADKAAKGQKKGMDQAMQISTQARQDVMSLFDQSAKSARIGMDQALNFYKQAATQRMTPFLQGNRAAQNVIGIGAQQAQNAILGLPVNMAAMNSQQQSNPSANYMIGAQLPQAQSGAGLLIEQEAAPAPIAQPAQQQPIPSSGRPGMLGRY